MTGTPEPRPFSPGFDRLFEEYRRSGAGNWENWLASRPRCRRQEDQGRAERNAPPMSETTTTFGDAVRAEIERVKKDSFVDGYQATDAEALGIALAGFFSWDGLEILRTAQYALEDANFHTESAIVGEMAEHVEAGEQPDHAPGRCTGSDCPDPFHRDETGHKVFDPDIEYDPGAGEPQPEGGVTP
jgi:hypothetical protein